MNLLLIPARGGSKGLPGKNLRKVGGISLVGRAIRGAREFIGASGISGAAVVVDTDSDDIAEEARRWGGMVPFLRAPALAQDSTSTVDSTLGFLDRWEPLHGPVETIILLQPTSPLRVAEDVGACWRSYHPTERPSIASVTRMEHPPELALRFVDHELLDWRHAPLRAPRRQDFVPAFGFSGSVYITSVRALREHRDFMVPRLTRGVELPAERGIDVDTAAELAVADALLGIAAERAAPLSIQGRQIGAGAPCFLIAEAGVNHNGDPALAHRLVDVAADAGADAVKFQTFEPDRLVAQGTPKAAYQSARTGSGESQHTLLQRLVLPHQTLRSLARHAADRGIIFLSTPFDESSADLLHELGVPAYKVSSGEVTNHRFLRHLARLGKPILLSTGMSYLHEVADAVDVIREAGAPPLALLHCVTNYPAAPGDCNLAAMATMRRAFSIPVGWSDHTAGLAIGLAAVGMGAAVLEKHFTTNRSLPGPDHLASLEPHELEELVREVRAIEAARGNGEKRPATTEADHRQLVRRSLHAASDLPRGRRISAHDLIALRPGTGITAAEEPMVLGRTLRNDVSAGQLLREEDLD